MNIKDACGSPSHFTEDTPEARRLIAGVIRRVNFRRTICDATMEYRGVIKGLQVWAHLYHGQIINAGRNIPPIPSKCCVFEESTLTDVIPMRQAICAMHIFLLEMWTAVVEPAFPGTGDDGALSDYRVLTGDLALDRCGYSSDISAWSMLCNDMRMRAGYPGHSPAEAHDCGGLAVSCEIAYRSLVEYLPEAPVLSNSV